MLEQQLAEAKDAAAQKDAALRDLEKRQDVLAREREKASACQETLAARDAELSAAQEKLSKLMPKVEEFEQELADAHARAENVLAEKDALTSDLEASLREARATDKLLTEANARLAERDDFLAHLASATGTQVRQPNKKEAKKAGADTQDIDTLPLPFAGVDATKGSRAEA